MFLPEAAGILRSSPETDPELLNQWLAPARAASAALPGYIVGASDWLRSIWQDRAAFADKSALVLWGLKDIAFRRKELERWRSALRDVGVQEFEDRGHFWRRRHRAGSWRRCGATWKPRSALGQPPTSCPPTGFV